MSVAPVRLGIAGCGLVVERGYLPALAGLRDIRLAGVADPVRDRYRVAGGVPGYRNLDEMLAAERLEAVLICSPPELHLEHAEACAAARIPTLVEKPPGLSLDHARRLSALRPEPTIGFNRRFADGLPIGSHRVDAPSRVTAIFDAPPGDWNRGHCAVDALWDFGCHLVDLACWITAANPLRARAIEISPSRACFEVEMTGELRLHAECGAAGHYRELIDIRDVNGEMRTWRWPAPAHRDAVARLARRSSPMIRSWRAQLRAFAGVVRGADPGRLAVASDGVAVIAALEAVEASAAGGHPWVTVPACPRRPDELSG